MKKNDVNEGELTRAILQIGRGGDIAENSNLHKIVKAHIARVIDEDARLRLERLLQAITKMETVYPTILTKDNGE